MPRGILDRNISQKLTVLISRRECSLSDSSDSCVDPMILNVTNVVTRRSSHYSQVRPTRSRHDHDALTDISISLNMK